MNKKFLTHHEIIQFARALADFLPGKAKVYPIPRGGVPVAYILKAFSDIEIVETPSDATVFIDDIYDSGETCRRWLRDYPSTPFYALIDKKADYPDYWVVFPWENSVQSDTSGEDIVTRLLQYVGEDSTRGGLVETPKRVIKAWEHWASGYNKNPDDILKVFEDGGEAYDQMVTVKDIPIYSHCEHHLAPFFGTCTISYIPNGKIVGLSKLSRLADMYSKRLQVQERLTNQIANAIMQYLNPLGVGVHIKARHLCMESRGICQQGHHTITTALLGEMKENPQTRDEFMSTVK